MDTSVLLAACLAAAAYCLTPGPAVLALLGIGAEQGRRSGAEFICGHLVGDLLWATLALLAIVGSRMIGAMFFDLLGLACGGYLGWIGLRCVLTRRLDDGRLDTEVRRPLLHGLAFGLTNPKGYPVAVAMFTALLAGKSNLLGWSSLPLLLIAAFIGFILADALLVLVLGMAPVRRVYHRYQLWIVRASGLLFIGFAVHAVMHAVPSLVGRRVWIDVD